MLIPREQRETALAVLGGLDPIDLIAAIGALQLLPQNANALPRLEAAAGVARSLGAVEGGAPIADERVLAWVNRPVFANAGVFNNVFTDEFLFHYGSFVVFPGLREDVFFVVRMLARAVLHSRGLLAADFFRRAQALAAATLMTSDAVARKAGLGRGVEAIPQESTYAVAAGSLARLKEAVTFTTAELRQWIQPIPIEALKPLIEELPALAEPGLPAEAPLCRPIVRDGDRFVVAAPHFLLSALVHAILTLAREHDQLNAVASEFHDAVYGSVLLSARYTGWDEVDTGLTERGDLRARESVFLFDQDKLAHVLVVADDLAGFDGRQFSTWDTEAISAKVEERLAEVRDHLLDVPQQPDSVLQLVVFQALGRESYFLLDEGSNPAPRLLLTAAELETIPLLEGGRRLLLWKYARSRARFFERTRPVHTSELDLFHLYRENDDSFYLFDDALPGVGYVVPEGVRVLREETQRKRDLHGAPYINGALVEVMLKEQQREIPIYFPMPPPPDRRGALMVEGYALPVWIFAYTVPPDGYSMRYSEILQMLAYWMWRFTPTLVEIIERLEERCHHLHLEVDLVTDDAWFGRSEDVAGATPDDVIECAALSPCRLQIRLRAGFLGLVDSADNAGERELMRRVVRGLVGLEAQARNDQHPLLDDAAIEVAVEEHAPLGPQKMIVLIDASADPTLDNREVPDARFAQGDDEALVMDELGEYLIEELGLPIGLIVREERTEVLKAAVAFHLRQLEELVATLSADGLLEWLVLANEALVVDFNRMRFEIPTKAACFGDVGDIREQLAKRFPRSTTASVANRFLIEYIAARPPTGSRRMSYALYDRLLAIAAQLHGRGYISDLIHFKLDDPLLSVLPSRRLGVGRNTRFMEGREAYLEEFTRAEVARSVDRFPRLWRRETQAGKPDVAEYDAALVDEVGLTLSEIHDFFAGLFARSYEREHEVKVARVSELLDELEQELGWQRERVERAFELFALRPRERFAPPGAPFRLEDVYPWRFNRALSYVRRPLVVRPGTDGDEVVWGVRGCYVAQQYFGNLVIDGRLKADSSRMRSLIGRLRDEDGRAFNDAVAELFEAQAELIVRRQVKKVGPLRIERRRGEDLGDIDVLIADPELKRLEAVEAKDLTVARTPAELSNELKETFQARDDRQAAIARHVERVQWLRDHLGDVLKWLGIDDNPAAWEVEGLIVIDIELMSPYLVDLPFPVLTYRALQNQLRERSGSPSPGESGLGQATK
jgi:hypothetical protein